MVRFVEMLVCRIDRRHALHHSMATVVGFDRVRRAHALLQVQEELTESNQNGRRSNEEGGRREAREEGQREDKGENCSGSGCSQSEPPSSVDCARCRNTEDCMIATGVYTCFPVLLIFPGQTAWFWRQVTCFYFI